MLGRLVFAWKRMKLGLYLNHTQRLVQNGLKTETITLLEENIWKKFLDSSLGNDFFGCDTRSRRSKSKNK